MKKLKSVEIDLNEFKIILRFPGSKESLVLHFDTPSRRFYLSIIALIINEMKKQQEPEFIHIRKYKNELKLLDEFLSGKHASKNSESMLAKIRVAWRNRLPDLETATLFKVLDRDRIPPFEKGGKYRYQCSDMECDIWANFFRYDDVNKWCFKFAIESASIYLDDISIKFNELWNNYAWDEFTAQAASRSHIANPVKMADLKSRKKPAFALTAILVLGVAVLVIWNFYLRATPQSKEYLSPHTSSIAVLAFDNMSGDPDQEYFIEAFSENLISELSRNRLLAVIARNSSFKYRGKGADLNKVAKDLGVDWIVEGSLMRSTEDLRVTVQLIETKKFNHTYSERYDFKLKEIFDVQDEITQKIIAAMHVTISDHAIETALKKKNINLDSMDMYWRGQKEFYDSFEESGIEKLRKAEKWYKKAIERDPDNAWALASMVWTIFNLYAKGAADTEDIKLAYGLAKRARNSDPNNGDAQSAFGIANFGVGNDKLAIASYEKALKLDPNNTETMMKYAFVLSNMGRERAREGIKWMEKSMKLNPFPPSCHKAIIPNVYYFAGEYQKTIDSCLSMPYSENPQFLRFLIACHYQLGKIEQAKEYAKQLLIVQSNFSVKWYEEYLSRIKDKEAVQNLINAMRAVGLP